MKKLAWRHWGPAPLQLAVKVHTILAHPMTVHSYSAGCISKTGHWLQSSCCFSQPTNSLMHPLFQYGLTLPTRIKTIPSISIKLNYFMWQSLYTKFIKQSGIMELTDRETTGPWTTLLTWSVTFSFGETKQE